MTATYDGKLVMSVRAKRILPCCEMMHEAVYSRVLYLGTASKAPSIMLRVGDRKGLPVSFCPFCGASPEAGQ